MVSMGVWILSTALGVLFGTTMGLATMATTGRLWLAILVAGVWSAAVTLILGWPL